MRTHSSLLLTMLWAPQLQHTASAPLIDYFFRNCILVKAILVVVAAVPTVALELMTATGLELRTAAGKLAEDPESSSEPSELSATSSETAFWWRLRYPR